MRRARRTLAIGLCAALIAGRVMAGESILRPPRVTYGPILNNLGTPTQFVLSDVNRLRFLFHTDDAAVVWVVTGRMQRPDTQIVPFAFNVATQGAFIVSTQDLNVGAGTLLTLTVTITNQSGVSFWGRNWAQVQVIEGTGAAAIILGTLVQSHATTFMPAAWPGTPFRASIEGPGLVQFQALANPGAGLQAHWNPPGGARARFLSIGFLLTTAAGGGTRTPGVTFLIGGGTALTIWSPVGQAAGVAHQYWFASGGPQIDNSATFGHVNVPLPSYLPLKGFDEVDTAVVSMAGGDTITGCVVAFERWLEPA